MKKYIKAPDNIEDLFSLVEKECELIKKHFTPEEINKLKLDNIDPNSETTCIYGRMVGNCNNPRVNNFINENLDILIESRDFKNMDKFRESIRSCYYMTPLEEYIFERDEYYAEDNEVSEETEERIKKVINLLK